MSVKYYPEFLKLIIGGNILVYFGGYVLWAEIEQFSELKFWVTLSVLEGI